METKIKTITINGKEYVEKGHAAIVTDGEYAIVRTYAAGVFYGIPTVDKVTRTAVVKNARRVWYWSGAASLSQLAVDGTCRPDECKFPVAVPEVTLFQVEEIIPMTKKAKASLDAVKVWEQK